MGDVLTPDPDGAVTDVLEAREGVDVVALLSDLLDRLTEGDAR